MLMLIVDLCFVSAICFCLYFLFNDIGDLYQSI